MKAHREFNPISNSTLCAFATTKHVPGNKHLFRSPSAGDVYQLRTLFLSFFVYINIDDFCCELLNKSH